MFCTNCGRQIENYVTYCNYCGHKVEKAEQEAKEKAEQEAKEKAEQEAKEKAEQEAKEKAEQEAKEKAEQEAKEKAEQEAKEKAEQEAKEKAGQEAKEKAEQEAKEKAEQEAKEKAEQEAKEKAEQEAKEKAEQEAKEKAEDVGDNDTMNAPKTLRGLYFLLLVTGTSAALANIIKILIRKEDIVGIFGQAISLSIFIMSTILFSKSKKIGCIILISFTLFKLISSLYYYNVYHGYLEKNLIIDDVFYLAIISLSIINLRTLK